jgi:hypothetical protein
MRLINFNIRALIIGCFSLIFSLGVSARLNSTYAENLKQYGAEISREIFDENPLNGYVTFSIDENFKLVAFFVNGRVRSEHLLPKNPSHPKILSRNEVRDISMNMFAMGDRGIFHKQVNLARVKAFFFDKGLISYEYDPKNKRVEQYVAVKTLLYEPGNSYRHINYKAYI